MKLRTSPESTVRHGTISGHTMHHARGERPCDACTRAKSEYDARRRSAPERKRQNRMLARAQGRALRDLRQRHGEEYALLYAQHKQALAEETP